MVVVDVGAYMLVVGIAGVLVVAFFEGPGTLPRSREGSGEGAAGGEQGTVSSVDDLDNILRLPGGGIDN